MGHTIFSLVIARVFSSNPVSESSALLEMCGGKKNTPSPIVVYTSIKSMATHTGTS